MSITEEELAAFADGEIEGADRARVQAAVAADPALAAKVDQHRALRRALSDHFAPMLTAEAPTRLTDMLQPRADVIDLAAAREKRSAMRRWGWVAAPALAASLALALFMPRGDALPDGYAEGDLAQALETQLASAQDGEDTRILLSFRTGEGQYCRAFTSTQADGIACRDATGWALVNEGSGSKAQDTEFRQAGSSQGDVLAMAQDMAAGPALDADAEAAARDAGWTAR